MAGLPEAPVVELPVEPVAEDQQEFLIGRKYKLLKKIGSGSFGSIYLGVHISTGQEVAVKLEKSKATYPQLSNESKLFDVLKDGIGFPRSHWYGQENGFKILVMDLLGPSLENLFNFCGKKFSVKTVLMMADQMIRRVEYIHSKSYIHRDIKPDNFLMGTGKSCDKVFLIDFGLAKRYRDSKTRRHITYCENKRLTGTARYASTNSHLGREQSRRDDLEALGFVFVYFLRASLPWQGVTAETQEERYDKIAEMKMNTKAEDMCEGFPAEFTMYFNYVRSLKFEDEPDYLYLRHLFRSLFQTLKHQYDFGYDWKYVLKENSQPEPSGSGPSGQQAPENEASVQQPEVEVIVQQPDKK